MNWLNRLVILCMGVALAGCPSLEIKTSSIRDAVSFVNQRHDAYVQADDSLTGGQRSVYLGDSGRLWEAVRAEELEQSVFHTLVLPVATRHDAYVLADEGLSDLQRRTYLRSTSELLKLATE